MSERIIQIIQADRCDALCDSKDGGEIYIPIVCYALKEISDESGTRQEIVPMGWSEKRGVFDINKVLKVVALSRR